MHEGKETNSHVRNEGISKRWNGATVIGVRKPFVPDSRVGGEMGTRGNLKGSRF